LVPGGSGFTSRQIGEGLILNRPVGVEAEIGDTKDAKSESVTTAPPKPSVQTKIILDAMAGTSQVGDERWDKIADSLDLLFDRIDEVQKTQQQMQANLDLNTKAID
jgi:hypothetical protein